MGDEFLKIIKEIQATGQAANIQSQTTNDSTMSSKIITESSQTPYKNSRFVRNSNLEDESNKK